MIDTMIMSSGMVLLLICSYIINIATLKLITCTSIRTDHELEAQ